MTTQDYILGCLRFVCDIVNAFIYLSAIATSAIDVNLKIKRNIALIASCYYRHIRDGPRLASCTGKCFKKTATKIGAVECDIVRPVATAIWVKQYSISKQNNDIGSDKYLFFWKML